MNGKNEIKGCPLREALRRIVERTPCITDWRRANDGRMVRFFNWTGR